jgi:PAS domain S-box-containing protein
MVIGAVGSPAGDETESRRLFEAAFALSLAAVLVIDDERRFREVSHTACEILGRDREALLARRLDDCLPPASRARLRAVWPGYLRAKTWVHEVAILRTDGSLRRVVISAKANVLPGRHLLTFDHEPDHRGAEEDLEQLFADSPDLLVVAGSDGYFTRVNPACERTLGWSQEELLARPFLDRVHSEDLATTLDMLERLRDGAPRCTITHRLRCRDGGYRAIEWNMVRVPGQESLTAVGRVVPQRADGGATRPSRVREDVENLPADRDQAQGQEWLGDETYRGIEPSFVWAIEQQLHILDNVTRLSPEPRVAAVRCALALRQTLVQMGTIVSDLRRRPILADPAGGGPEPPAAARSCLPGVVAAELTKREREVIRLVAQGHVNHMICGELFLSEVTVKKHVQKIMSKFGVTSRTQAAIVAVKLGLDR